jgi:hypothetical protein
MAAQNLTPQEKIVNALLRADQVELPDIQNDVDRIGPSLHNAKECMRRMNRVLSYVVRHCLHNLAAPAAAGATLSDSQKLANNEAVLAALQNMPPGATMQVPDNSGPRASVQGRTINVVVGQTTTQVGSPLGALEPEPEASDVPTVIIGQGGSKVIPPRGSNAKPLLFNPGAPVDLTKLGEIDPETPET